MVEQFDDGIPGRQRFGADMIVAIVPVAGGYQILNDPGYILPVYVQRLNFYLALSPVFLGFHIAPSFAGTAF
jgi:hypothetical protein